MKHCLRKSLAALVGCAMAFTAITPGMPELLESICAAAASDCVINTSVEHQTIQGFGGINHPEWTGSDLTDAQIQTAFGNGEGQLGFTVLRVFVNPDRNQWYKALPVAQAATDMGVTVFASPWEPPAELAESGGDNGKLHLPESNYGAYAQHLNDFGTYMKDNGVDLYAISVQNEPDYAHDWTYWSSDETTNFLANYGDQITSTRVMSPESFQYTPENASWILGGQDGGKKYYNKILNNAKAMANCDLFGTHFYGTARDWMDFPALENSGKEIWMTEVYVPNSSSNANTWPEALEVATNIHNGLVVGNMSAYVWWYIRRSYGPMLEDGTISKRGDMMAQYSKFVRPDSIRVDATEQPEENILVSAYKNGDEVIVVAINNGTSDVVQEFSFQNEELSQVDRYRSSGTEKVVHTGQMELTGDGFMATLPAQSVSTFVASVSVEADENGYFFHDTFEGDTFSWTGHGSSDVTLSGRSPYMDAEALLVQNREKSWNGAEKALNSAAFVPGNEYSFSVCAAYLDGTNTTETFKLTLQYEDANGELHYPNIAVGTAIKGSYVQLANTNYLIPEGAKNMKLYVETESGTNNFYIDEAIGAVAGTYISGPVAKNFILGDVNFDGAIDAFDLTLAKKYYANGFDSAAAQITADVDQSGTVDVTDIQLLQDYLLTKITEFPEPELPTVDTAAMEAVFSSVTPAKSYKAANENNPLISQYFGADPGVMEYNGRVYVYMTNDSLLYDDSGNVTNNKYSSISTLRCISSDDMVNWTDHGIIQAAGSSGAAKWAGCSWAPTACHKTINGKEKFFLYFANNANGIGVLTSDSPTGPWTDPIGKALIDRSTANCSDVTWLFDPAVLVDDDGTGYLYFGGGVPDSQYANPKTARVVKLGADMTSLSGNPQVIDAPYLFEDAGINKIGDKYYYSYCSNWNTGGNSYGLTNAAIEYMVSDSPMGPFTYKGELFKNIGNFFGTVGNNHHTIQKFGNDYYLFYHAQYLQDSMGLTGGYRSTHVDKLTVNADGTIAAVTGTKTGVSQVKAVNPYTTVQAETLSHQGGITISGQGNTTVGGTKGSWLEISGVACGSGAKSITVNASSASGAVIKVCTGSASDTAVAYAEIPAGGSMQEITVPVSGLTGEQDLFFVFSNTAAFDSWKLNA